jgi:hypothetical protein
MSEFSNGYKWSQAAVKGLLLALVTIVCNTITYIFPGNAIVSLLAFLVRTALSIWLLVSFMKQYAATTGENPMSFALRTVLLSSLVCAFYDAAAMAWLFPSLIEQINDAMAQSLSMFPSDSQGVMEQMMDHYPRIAFFSTFVKNFIIGLIVAAIANSSTRKKDIFGGDGRQEENELA